MNRALLITVLCATVALSGCYNEIVPQHPSERSGLLPIAGAANVRDLGGYVGYGGRTVRYGMIIRSGEMSTLSARDRSLFTQMGIRYVVDFRSGNLELIFGEGEDYLDVVGFVSERRHAPTRLWDGAHVWDTGGSATDVPALGRNTSIPENTIVPDHESIIRASLGDELATIDGVIQFVRRNYRFLVTQSALGDPPVQREQYMNLFRAVLASVEAGTPVLFHCSAGKDRAGVAAALLFLALGVPEREIIANYMISQPFVYQRFFPVVPMIRQSVAVDMRQQRVGAMGLLSDNPLVVAGTEAGLRASMRRRVLQGTMQGIFNGIMQNGMPKDDAVIQARQQVNDIAAALDSGTPTGDAEFDARVQYIQDRIDEAFHEARDGMLELAVMTDAQIDAVAREGAGRIAPLLSVYPQWIMAALDEIRNVWGAGLGPNGTNCINAGIEAFLDGVQTGAAVGDPWHNQSGADIIQTLRNFYLE